MVEHEGRRFVIAEARLAAYARELGEDAAERIVRRLKGSELVGRSYTPPFTYFLGNPGSHRVLAAEYFCPVKDPIRNPKEGIDNLQRGGAR